MAIATRTEQVKAHDGGMFSAYLAAPEGGTGPGILLFHEILGVNSYVRGVADRLARLGYVVLAPDLFWRVDPDHPIERSDEEGFAEGISRVGSFDWQQGFHDGDAALGCLSRLEETTDSVGAVGFCMGGTLAYGVAVNSEPDAVVCYYGSGIADLLAGAGEIHCPVLFHFGADDPFITGDQIDAVRQAFAKIEGASVLVQGDAGHAFDNHLAAMYHRPVAAQEAWGQTVDFLRRTLGM